MWEIMLHPIVGGGTVDETHVVNPDAIRLLFAFPNLEVLQIRKATSFKDVDDALIKDIASEWPRLRSLELRYFTNPPVAPKSPSLGSFRLSIPRF